MTANPLQALIASAALPTAAFATDSRYYGFTTLDYAGPAGQPVPYLARRYVPQPGAQNFATVAQHVVMQGDRLDLIAAKYLGDPLVFWVICDANGAMRPGDLVRTPGTVLAITMPQGIPGGLNA